MVRVNRGNALLSLAIEWRRWIGLKIERGGGCCGGGCPLILVRRHNNTDTAPCRQLEKRKPRADRRRRAAVMHAITRINELWPYLWLYQPTATRRSSAPSSFSNPPPIRWSFFYAVASCVTVRGSRIERLMPRYRDPRDRPRKDVVLDGKAISRRSCVGILCACMERCLVWNEVSFENRPRHFSRTLRIFTRINCYVVSKFSSRNYFCIDSARNSWFFRSPS